MKDQPDNSVDVLPGDSGFALKIVIALLIVFALWIDGYAFIKGLDAPVLYFSQFTPDGYKRFHQVLAWWPFPLYFWLVYFVVRQSWDAFNKAWLTLPDTEVLCYCEDVGKDKAEADSDKNADDKKKEDEKKKKLKGDVANKILPYFNRWRHLVFIPLSLVLGFTSAYLDSERERDTMQIFTLPGNQCSASNSGLKESRLQISDNYIDAYDGPKTTLAGQVARACESPDFMSKWLWMVLAGANIDASEICACNGKTDKITMVSREKQFNLRRDKAEEFLFALPPEQKCCVDYDDVSKQVQTAGTNIARLSNCFVEPPGWQKWPVVLMHIEDAILISFGWLIFLQCIAHPVFFWCFERLKVSQHDDKPFLCIRLNTRSVLGEFGLEHWNHALNNLYWYFALALIIPILSRFSQPDLKDLDTSQIVLQLLIPVLVAVPMVTTILSRQNRLPTCWDAISADNVTQYKKQRLWPLDENWSSKLGVVLAFIILGLSFGYNLAALI